MSRTSSQSSCAATKSDQPSSPAGSGRLGRGDLLGDLRVHRVQAGEPRLLQGRALGRGHLGDDPLGRGQVDLDLGDGRGDAALQLRERRGLAPPCSRIDTHRGDADDTGDHRRPRRPARGSAPGSTPAGSGSGPPERRPRRERGRAPPARRPRTRGTASSDPTSCPLRLGQIRNPATRAWRSAAMPARRLVDVSRSLSSRLASLDASATPVMLVAISPEPVAASATDAGHLVRSSRSAPRPPRRWSAGSR